MADMLVVCSVAVMVVVKDEKSADLSAAVWVGMMVVLKDALKAGRMVDAKVDWKERSTVVHLVVHSAVHSESW